MQDKVDFGGMKPVPWSLKFSDFLAIDFDTVQKWTK
jgi:hypothetical protein